MFSFIKDTQQSKPVFKDLTSDLSVSTAYQANAQVVALLARFQEKGRLIDFLMENIQAYNDTQVGAATRVVHQGCKAVLQEYFSIQPVRQEDEGVKITIPVGYVADEYRLIGKIVGQAPFSGTLVHRGWKTDLVKLPRPVQLQEGRLPIIAPAEVELS
jgi:hypothetical protein